MNNSRRLLSIAAISAITLTFFTINIFASENKPIPGETLMKSLLSGKSLSDTLKEASTAVFAEH